MKRSYIIGISVAMLLALAIIFWPKQAKNSENPVSLDSELAETSSTKSGTTTDPTTNPAGEHATNLSNSQQASETKQETAKNPKQEKIDFFVEKSRIIDEFKAMDDLLEAQLGQIADASQLSPEEQAELDQLKEMVSSERLLAEYKKELSEKLSEKEVERLNEIYKDHNMEKLKESEVFHQTPEGQKELMESWKNFDRKNVAADRLAAAEEMDRSSHRSDNTMRMIGRVADMAAKAGGGDPNATAKDSEAFRKQLEKPVRDAVLIQNLQNTKNMSVADMMNISQKQQDSAMQKEGEVRTSVMERTLDNVAAVAEKNQKDHKKDKK